MNLTCLDARRQRKTANSRWQGARGPAGAVLRVAPPRHPDAVWPIDRDIATGSDDREYQMIYALTATEEGCE